MEKTTTQLSAEIKDTLKALHPDDDTALTYARFVGGLLAYTEKETLKRLLENLRADLAKKESN